MLRFTPEELAEMAAADAEIDAAPLAQEDYLLSAELDRDARRQRLDNKQREIAAHQRAYYEANREEIAAKKRAYREANREEIAAKKRAYYEANREQYNTYMREYRQKRKEREAHHAPQNPGAANQQPNEGGGL